MAEPEAARRVTQWLGWEVAERGRRSLERRARDAHIGRIKPLADFDWSWPEQIDRAAVDDLMTLQFLADASNVVLVGPNGVGKTMWPSREAGFLAVGHTAAADAVHESVHQRLSHALTKRYIQGCSSNRSGCVISPSSDSQH